MIELDDHRERNLKMTFAGASDRDLIHELVRRGRLRQSEASVSFWPEMRADIGYMRHIRERVLQMIVHEIAKDDPTLLITERPGGGASFFTADIVYLVARKKEENR